MEDYKANSHKSKEESKSEKKEIKPIVKGKVSKKKNVKRKFADTFISEDIGNVKSYVILDVLIPAAKKAISDIITNGIDMLLYGETGRTNKKRSNVDYVSYNRYSDRDRRDDRDDRYSRSRTVAYSYDDIVLETRADAEDVLESMQNLIDDYEMASVADLYDLVGVTGSYTDNKYGWTNLRNAGVDRVRDGYVLRLPKATPLR